MGVSDKTVSKWETGTAIPKTETLIKLAEEFRDMKRKEEERRRQEEKIKKSWWIGVLLMIGIFAFVAIMAILEN